MENIKFKNYSPIGKPNGKSIKLIAEFCQSWNIFNSISNFKSLIVSNLAKKGYNIYYNIISMPFKIPKDYNIYKIENNKKILIFSNKDEEKKNGVIIGFEIDETNVDDLINKIIS